MAIRCNLKQKIRFINWNKNLTSFLKLFRHGSSGSGFRVCTYIYRTTYVCTNLKPIFCINFNLDNIDGKRFLKP